MKLKKIIFTLFLFVITGCQSSNAQDDVYILKIVEFKPRVFTVVMDDSETAYDGYNCEIYKKTEKIGNIILIIYSNNIPKIEIGAKYQVKPFNINTNELQLEKPNIDIKKIKFLTRKSSGRSRSANY